MGSIKEEKLVGLGGWIWGERKEESRTTLGFLTWVTGWCHRGNREGGEGVGRKEGGDGSVRNISGLRYGRTDKPEGAAHLESSACEWSEEEIELMWPPKRRASCERGLRLESRTRTNVAGVDRTGEQRRRITTTTATQRGHGSQRAEGLRKKGMVCGARWSSRVH